MNKTKKNHSESIEDYLEAILLLQKDNKAVRSIDIAKHFHYSKPSVSIAMKNLQNKELITVDESGFINLTKAGKKIANDTYKKHQVISGLLINLGVSEKIALEDACHIEHDISDETFKVLKKYFKTSVNQNN